MQHFRGCSTGEGKGFLASQPPGVRVGSHHSTCLFLFLSSGCSLCSAQFHAEANCSKKHTEGSVTRNAVYSFRVYFSRNT